MVDKTLDKINTFVPEKWRWVLQHGGFRKYFKNTGWMFLGRIFSLIISFFVGAYVARYLGPSDYGVLSYVISFVGLFSFLASLGVDNVVGRELVKNCEIKEKIISTGFYLKIIGSIISILIIFIISTLTVHDTLTRMLIFLFSFSFIFQAFNIIEIYFYSQVLSKNVFKTQIFTIILSSFLKILFIILGKSIIFFVIIYLVEIIFYSLCLVLLFKKHIGKIKKYQINKYFTKKLLKNSLPLMFSGIAGSIYLRIDQVMIKNMINNESLGVFSAGVKLSEIWYFIPIMICTSVFPAIVRAKKINYHLYINRMLKLYSLMFWLSLLIIVPVLLYSSFIIKFLFGNDYLSASSVLNIYVLTCIPVFLWTALNQFLITENYVNIILWQSIFLACINIILNIILIPILGINGAAMATIISYSLGLAFYTFFKETRKQIFLMIKSIFIIKYEN